MKKTITNLLIILAILMGIFATTVSVMMWIDTKIFLASLLCILWVIESFLIAYFLDKKAKGDRFPSHKELKTKTKERLLYMGITLTFLLGVGYTLSLVYVPLTNTTFVLSIILAIESFVLCYLLYDSLLENYAPPKDTLL